jgi:hypothetical protein
MSNNTESEFDELFDGIGINEDDIVFDFKETNIEEQENRDNSFETKDELTNIRIHFYPSKEEKDFIEAISEKRLLSKLITNLIVKNNNYEFDLLEDDQKEGDVFTKVITLKCSIIEKANIQAKEQHTSRVSLIRTYVRNYFNNKRRK